MLGLDRGIAACPNLQQLWCEFSTVDGPNDNDISAIGDGAVHVPHAMTSLTTLENLSLRIGDPENDEPMEGIFAIDWVTCLTSLQRLHVRCEYRFTACAGLSALSKLTCLYLQSMSDAPSEMDVDWQQMTSLRTVSLGGTCAFDHRLLRLAKIPCLL